MNNDKKPDHKITQSLMECANRVTNVDAMPISEMGMPAPPPSAMRPSSFNTGAASPVIKGRRPSKQTQMARAFDFQGWLDSLDDNLYDEEGNYLGVSESQMWNSLAEAFAEAGYDFEAIMNEAYGDPSFDWTSFIDALFGGQPWYGGLESVGPGIFQSGGGEQGGFYMQWGPNGWDTFAYGNHLDFLGINRPQGPIGPNRPAPRKRP